MLGLVRAALALFDQYGSATDSRGRHYEGQAGLTEFLLASGFNSPDAHIETEFVVLSRCCRDGRPIRRRSGRSAHRLRAVERLADDVGVAGVLRGLGNQVQEHAAD
jgi:hypothetical protein